MEGLDVLLAVSNFTLFFMCADYIFFILLLIFDKMFLDFISYVQKKKRLRKSNEPDVNGKSFSQLVVRWSL